MKISKIFVLAIILTIFGSNNARSQGLSDLLGGNLGNTLSNLVEGVFSSSNITVADMAGDWQSTGPAVCFQSDNFLKKAGGIAAASAVEAKLAPYYEQYGLNNASLVVDKQGNFTLNLGKLVKLNGTITQDPKAQKGVFTFNFKALGMNISSMTTYVQKTSTSMDVMFDASKFKSLLSTIGQLSGISIVKTLSGILESYDGLCVGFNFKGNSSNSNSSIFDSGVTPSSPDSVSGSGFGLGNILNGLGIGTGNTNSNSGTGNNSNSNSESQNGQTNQTQGSNDKGAQDNSSSSSSQNNVSKGLNLLKQMLGK